MKKRILSLFLVMMMLCTILAPVAVSAETTPPTYTVLVLDTSGQHKFTSGGETIYTADSAIEEVKTAACNFTESLLNLNNNHYVAVVTYKDNATTLSGFSQDSEQILKNIKNLGNTGGESVNVASGLERAHSLLSSIKEEGVAKNVIIFTTGLTNTGNYSNSGLYDSSVPGSDWYNNKTKVYLYRYANQAIKKAQVLHEYANVYSVGLFENWDDMPSKGKEIVEFFKMFTEDLANPLENFNPVYSKNDLDKAFAEICNDIIDNPFFDVTYQGYFFEAVIWAEEEGITTGTNASTFNPNEICTREQMVTFLWRKMGRPEPMDTLTAFTDLNPNGYSYKPILWAEEEGITNGTKPDLFSPKQTVTREQVVTFLWRIAGCPEVTEESTTFIDLNPNAYSYDAILWAQQEGITTGTTPTTFEPQAPCTRAQIITFMYRYYVQ